MRLILASASPRRADLLRAAGFEFGTFAADVDERVRPNESPAEYVQRLASEKSAAASTHVASGFSRMTIDAAACAGPAESRKSHPAEAGPHGGHVGRDLIVIGADTAVVVDGRILGKPEDDEESAAMLRELSGRRHEVMTGISLRAGSRERRHVETTAVYFATLSDEDVAWYVRSGEGRDKAGAYAIQGLGSRFIPRIEGSYANVVGLPIAAVCELIRSIETALQCSGTGD
jgi:septum formation protein